MPDPVLLSSVETQLVLMAVEERDRAKAAADRQFAARVKCLVDLYAPGAKSVNFADAPEGKLQMETT